MPVWKYEMNEVRVVHGLFVPSLTLLHDKITVENVAECLYSMGLGHLDKENFFEVLVGSADPEKTISLAAEDGPKARVTDEEVTSNFCKDQLFRTPRHTLPLSMLRFTLPSHHELSSMDDVLPDEIDLEELSQQLDEDIEVNTQDEKASADYELSLWDINQRV